MIAELEARINQSSKNSSRPPSSDSPADQAEATKTRAERRAEAKEQRKDEVARRRGKQPGAAGKNLAVVSCPDVVVEHEATTCASCGEDLAAALVEGIERRQVFDTPRAGAHLYRAPGMRRRCAAGRSRSGHVPRRGHRSRLLRARTSGPPPSTCCTASTSRSSGPPALSDDARRRRLDRLRRLARQRGSGRTGGPFLSEVARSPLVASPVVHVDETSDQVRTKTWWFHVASNDALHATCSPARPGARPLLTRPGVLGRFSGVMVHDRLAMYFKYKTADHLICGAHLLRDLAAVGVRWNQSWAGEMSASAHRDQRGLPRGPRRRAQHLGRSGRWRTSSPPTTPSSKRASPRTPPRGPRARLPRAQVVQRRRQRPRDCQVRPPASPSTCATVHQQRRRALVAHGQVAQEDQRLLPKRRRCPALRDNPLLPLDGPKARRWRPRRPGQLFRGEAWMPPRPPETKRRRCAAAPTLHASVAHPNERDHSPVVPRSLLPPFGHVKTSRSGGGVNVYTGTESLPDQRAAHRPG